MRDGESRTGALNFNPRIVESKRMDGKCENGYCDNKREGMRTKGTKEAVKLLAATLANFSIAGFTLGIYQQDTLGLVTGCYSLAFALVLAWRVEE